MALEGHGTHSSHWEEGGGGVGEEVEDGVVEGGRGDGDELCVHQARMRLQDEDRLQTLGGQPGSDGGHGGGADRPVCQGAILQHQSLDLESQSSCEWEGPTFRSKAIIG